MSRKDDIAAAELASVVGGHMKSVEGNMTEKSSTDVSGAVDPREFLNQGGPRHNRPTTNQVPMPPGAVIEQPKSKPAGSEIVGIEEVRVADLIPSMDGMDKDMQEAIKRHSQAPIQPTPAPRPSIPIHAAPNPSPVSAAPNELIRLLNEINDKLDLILKRAKIQPRYRKKKQ